MNSKNTLTSLLYILIILNVSPLSGQIINIENARKTTDTLGFSGGASLMGSYFDNNSTVWNIKTQSDIQWKSPKHIYWFLTDLSFLKSDSKDLQNLLYLHLRHNYKINKTWRFETFAQYQYNKIKRIENRILFGLGPRVKLFEKEKTKAYFGSLLMSEWEDPINDTPGWNYETRLSNYFSITFSQSDVFSIRSTTYYQPSLHKWINFRLHNEEKIEFYLTKIISLVSSLQYSYDRFPILDAPQYTLQMVVGIKCSF